MQKYYRNFVYYYSFTLHVFGPKVIYISQLSVTTHKPVFSDSLIRIEFLHFWHHLHIELEWNGYTILDIAHCRLRNRKLYFVPFVKEDRKCGS